jgi:hypothetical protein
MPSQKSSTIYYNSVVIIYISKYFVQTFSLFKVIYIQLLTWVLRDDETGSIEMAVPRVLPCSPIEEIHRKGGIGDCIFGKETASSKLNGAAVHLSLSAAVFYVVKKPISICGRLNNAPSIPSLVYWLEKERN